MFATPAVASRSTTRRLAYAVLATLFLAAICFEVGKHGTGLWQAFAFGLGPDLALFYGVGSKLEKGQLHPRAVRLYNLVHSFWLPLALMTAAAFDVIPLGFLVGGLAWCLHISGDRALGYGLRTRDGFQRS